jgi:hypothetical protein
MVALAAPPRGAGRADRASDADRAFQLLGIAPSDSLEQADAAYAGLVRRYNPATVLELGTEFAVLAVKKRNAATAAYEAVRDTLTGR